MKKNIKLFIVICFILCCVYVSKANAADYYVSPTGSASWSECTNINTPCSLSTANKNAQAGDTVYLRGGTYNKQIAPSNSGEDANNRIIYTAYQGEDVLITDTGKYNMGIFLNGNDYVKIEGVTVKDVSHSWVNIRNWADYNEIANCTFTDSTGKETALTFLIWGQCSGGTAFDCYATNNWIHDNLIYKHGGISSTCDDLGDLMKIGAAYADIASGYNTIEDNVFYWGGHMLLNTFTKNNVIRNNVFHNEGWMDDPGTCRWGPSPRNGKYGNRNIEIDDCMDSGPMYNLVESNRAGHTAFASDGGMDGSIVITSQNNIVRYNYVFYTETTGIYFKKLFGSSSDYNRVYDNTVFASGQDSMLYPYEWTQGVARQEARWGIALGLSPPASTGNVIKNNLVYDSYTQDIHVERDADLINTIVNNWLTEDGDPLFVNPDVSDPMMSATLPDLSLQSDSPVIDKGMYLTNVSASDSGAGTTLRVDDAMYFQDGTWGSELTHGVTHFPDWVAVGSVDNVAQIQSIDYDTNTITLTSSIIRNDGDPIWLYKDSTGRRVLYGSAPDIGAHEYAGETQPTCQSLGYKCCDSCESETEQNSYDDDCSPQVCCESCVVQHLLPEQYIEAENGDLTSPMQAGSDSAASGGQCVYTTTDNQGSVSFTFDIQQAGEYRMEAKLLNHGTPVEAHDSFYVGLDNEAAQGNNSYAYDTLKTDVFAWDNVSLRGSGTFNDSEFDPMVWELSKGLHTFTFYGRESNTWLDQIILKEIFYSQCGDADTNDDGVVDLDELYAFVDRWKNNEVVIGELMATIAEWKYGC